METGHDLSLTPIYTYKIKSIRTCWMAGAESDVFKNKTSKFT